MHPRTSFETTALFLTGHIIGIFHCLSQKWRCYLKMDAWSARDTHMLYYCEDIGGVLRVTLSWIHPIHLNMCWTQWEFVGNNRDYGGNRFVYGYVTQHLWGSSAIWWQAKICNSSGLGFRVCLIGANSKNGRLGQLGICVWFTTRFRKRQVWQVWKSCRTFCS